MSDDNKAILMFAILMIRNFTRLETDKFSIIEVDFDDKTSKECYYIKITFYNHKTHKEMFLRTSLLSKDIDSYIYKGTIDEN